MKTVTSRINSVRPFEQRKFRFYVRFECDEKSRTQCGMLIAEFKFILRQQYAITTRLNVEIQSKSYGRSGQKRIHVNDDPKRIICPQASLCLYIITIMVALDILRSISKVSAQKRDMTLNRSDALQLVCCGSNAENTNDWVIDFGFS